VAALVLGVAADGHALDPAMPGPAPRGHAFDASARNAACEGCHVEIAAEWRSSQHHRATTDAFYQRALAVEPLAFCRGCHAPEADPSRVDPGGAGALGVGCVTCHVSGDSVLAAPAGTVTARPRHPVLRDARFGGDDACAGCHDFAFPGGEHGLADRMQATVHEHLQSTNASTSCAACHMPGTGGPGTRHLRHDFTVDSSLLRAAVTVTAARTGPRTLRVTLVPTRAGHAMPTGDLFRRLEVRGEAVGVDFSLVASATRYLTRHWRTTQDALGAHRTVASDDRLQPSGAAVAVDLDLGPSAPGFAFSWRVAYQRVEHPRSESESESLVGDEVVLGEGTLPRPATLPSP
jgi:hypothetical protein